jgi:hypothetical protein
MDAGDQNAGHGAVGDAVPVPVVAATRRDHLAGSVNGDSCPYTRR